MAGPIGLERAREFRGLTQQQLARRSGVSQAAIATIEGTADPNPRWETVCRLSMALRIPPGRLFGWKRPAAKRREARA